MESERKTRVLVVHRSEGVAVAEADALRNLGYDVGLCSGPARFSCPVMRGERCADAEWADVLVYDVWATTESDGGQRLVEGLRDLYPEIPIVLTSPGMLLSWVETEGAHKVTPLEGVPTRDRLDVAIREAMSGAQAPFGADARR